MKMLFSTIRKLIPFVNSNNHIHNKHYNSVIWGGGGGGGGGWGGGGGVWTTESTEINPLISYITPILFTGSSYLRVHLRAYLGSSF